MGCHSHCRHGRIMVSKGLSRAFGGVVTESSIRVSPEELLEPCLGSGRWKELFSSNRVCSKMK